MSYMSALEELELTNSEIKVYLALLKLGESKKGPIVQESKISSSKIYDVTGKLTNKGLVSVIVKNKVKHFKAAPPNQLFDLIKKKRKKLDDTEKQMENILPELNKLMQERDKKEIAEMYIGWKGLKTVYDIIVNTLEKDNVYYVLGAAGGVNKKRTERFYMKVSESLKKENIRTHILFGNIEREYAKKFMSRYPEIYEEFRFLDFGFPAEVAIFRNNIAIIIHAEEPIGLIVRNKTLAKSFKAYYDALWKISSP